MRVAFYAPMKPPTHPSPSGDRRMGRLLMQALSAGGHEVELASIFRSYDRGDRQRQDRLRRTGLRLADRLVRSYRRRPADQRPQLWLTYHLYHKAPDWIGPVVADVLDIPYVAVEASHAPKQAGGPWDQGFRETAKTIAAADLLISLNETDSVCLAPLLQSPDRLVFLPPFIDTGPFVRAAEDKSRVRRLLAEQTGLDTDAPWLIVAAMMRDDQKLQSYRLLARALQRLTHVSWQLIVVGDGVSRDKVRADFSAFQDRTAWLGMRPHEDLPVLLAAADIYVWPAVKEAFGLAFLEAQAAGLPVIAGHSGGVAGIIEDGRSGLLVAQGDDKEFAQALSLLLDDTERRRAMGQAAQERVSRYHHVDGAALSLNKALIIVTERR